MGPSVVNVVKLPGGVVPMPTRDPFLFCVHHNDRYPRANGNQGPATSLSGRPLGQDFEARDGFRMYHGRAVPGFPRHPHRGFETVTIVREGLLDHADSMGAAARYGQGDVQWLTAGRGMEHSEMFPLLSRDAENPVELFQIWLNLPARNKLVAPHFSMLWADQLPTVQVGAPPDALADISLYAGALGSAAPPAPPPNSWAADPNNQVAIWSIRLPAHGRFAVPATAPGIDRSLYTIAGGAVRVDDTNYGPGRRLDLAQQRSISLQAAATPAELLLLQGRPIGEPVAHHGPFVMNTRQQLLDTMREYQAGGFGTWPWDRTDPVHGTAPRRFARRPDGTTETPSDVPA